MDDLSDVEQILPSGTVEAAARRAEQMAEQTGEFLRDLGLIPAKPTDEPIYLPGEFLLELAAVLQRGHWEQSGLTDSIGENLSSAQDDMRRLFDRLIHQPDSFQDGEGAVENARLSKQTLRLWLERCAWAGPEMLESDVVLGDLDDDELVERLAEVLWAHRRDFRTDPDGDKP